MESRYTPHEVELTAGIRPVARARDSFSPSEQGVSPLAYCDSSSQCYWRFPFGACFE
jgi:hypothetical protein